MRLSSIKTRTLVSAAIAGWLALGMPAFASDGAQSAAAAKVSAAELVAYVETAAKNGERPDYSKEPIAGHLKRIFDFDALAALPPEKADDLDWLLDWDDSTRISNRILVTYEGGKDGGPQAAVRNLLDHEAEICRALSFTLRLQSRMARTGPLFMESLPPEQRTDIRKRGLQNLTRNLVVVALNTSGMLVSMPLKPDDATVIAASLRDTAGAWVPYTTADERAKFIEVFKRGSAMNSKARPALEAATATIANFKN